MGLGDAGAFGDAFGGPSGGSGFSAMEGFAWGSLIGSFLGPVAGFFGGVIGAVASLGEGAPGDPGPTGGPGLDYPVSQTTKAITQAVAAPVAKPVTPPPTPPPVDDRHRKRIGRQETILTSRSALSDAPTYRPTLLGQ